MQLPYLSLILSVYPVASGTSHFCVPVWSLVSGLLTVPVGWLPHPPEETWKFRGSSLPLCVWDVLSHGYLSSWNPFLLRPSTSPCFSGNASILRFPKTYLRIPLSTPSPGCGSAPRLLLVIHEHLTSSSKSLSSRLDGKWRKGVIFF